ncbi:hypothetical protein [Pseudomonas sp. RL_105y_Pfl2_101]|uniref:hypothetical protein n=1 Tax=Pseudomonas sp. RL_105y_Pfl2_101 TaxID=3088708 RepID=UPI0030DBE3FC
MKQKIKMLLRFFEKCLSTFVSLVFILFFSRRTVFEKKSNRSEKVIVLGNGPSLRTDLEAVVKLSSNSYIDVCVVNDFAFSDAFFKIRPCFYVLADPNYWKEGVIGELHVRRERLIDILVNKVTWPMRVMLPVEAKQTFKLNDATSQFVAFEFYNRTPVDGFDCMKFRLFDYRVGMPPPFNVLIAALTLSIANGYKKIFVLGADHSWHEELSFVDGEGVLVAQKHFYDNEAERKPVYKDGSEFFTIGDLFIRWGKVFKIYEILALYASYRGAVVYNLSSKTYIDAFPRATIEEFDEL